MPGRGVKNVVGLTGGIGSGKSVIGMIISDLGYPVFDSDLCGKQLLTENANVVKKITLLFGAKILSENGQPDRKKIAQRVFNNSRELEELNAIIHPEVNREFQTWKKAQISPFVVRESALLFETGFYKESYKNILVSCPVELRIARVMKRNSISREAVLERMKNQAPEEEKTKLADYIIVNDEKNAVLPQVWHIIKQLQS